MEELLKGMFGLATRVRRAEEGGVQIKLREMETNFRYVESQASECLLRIDSPEWNDTQRAEFAMRAACVLARTARC